MKREVLESIIQQIHNNFYCVLVTTNTFRGLEIYGMENLRRKEATNEINGVENLTQEEATNLYDTQVKKLKSLVDNLAIFSEYTPAELTDAQVIIRIKELKDAINKVLQIDDNHKRNIYYISLAWSKTALRQATLALAAKNSFALIEEFLTQHNLTLPVVNKNSTAPRAVSPVKSPLVSHVTTQGFGGFAPAATNAKKATYTVPQRRGNFAANKRP
jgi:hypothetical protein